MALLQVLWGVNDVNERAFWALSPALCEGVTDVNDVTARLGSPRALLPRSGRPQPPSPTGLGQSIAPDGGAVTERSEGQGAKRP